MQGIGFGLTPQLEIVRLISVEPIGFKGQLAGKVCGCNKIMSDIITRKCAVCGGLKPLTSDPSATKWLRVPFIQLGNSSQPTMVIPPKIQLQRVQGLNNTALDFCPDCQPKVTLDRLPSLIPKP